MTKEENISLNFRLKKIDETRNFYIEKIKENDLIRKKSKRVCADLKTLNNHLL